MYSFTAQVSTDNTFFKVDLFSGVPICSSFMKKFDHDVEISRIAWLCSHHARCRSGRKIARNVCGRSNLQLLRFSDRSQTVERKQRRPLWKTMTRIDREITGNAETDERSFKGTNEFLLRHWKQIYNIIYISTDNALYILLTAIFLLSWTCLVFLFIGDYCISNQILTCRGICFRLDLVFEYLLSHLSLTVS